MPTDPPLVRAPRRYFTPAEAAELLPVVREHVARLVGSLHRAQELADVLERSATGREVTMGEIESLKRTVQGVMAAIEGHGVELKGVQPALLDFPASRNGQDVYLCWREGEDAIAWWHPMHTGVAGRQALDGDVASWAWFS